MNIFKMSLALLVLAACLYFIIRTPGSYTGLDSEKLCSAVPEFLKAQYGCR